MRIEHLRVDIVDAFRHVRRTPGMAAFATTALFVAVTVNAVMFSLLNATSLRTVRVPSPRSLVAVEVRDLVTGRSGFVYQPTFDHYRSAQRSFDHVAMYVSPMLLRGDFRGDIVDVVVEAATSEFFQVIGLVPSAGRPFSAKDDISGAPPIAVVSDRFAALHFPNISPVGAEMTIEARPVTIVGVMPPNFLGVSGDAATDMWLPIVTARSLLGADASSPVRASQMIAKLADGSTIAAAATEAETVWPQSQSVTLPLLSPALHASLKNQTVLMSSAAKGFSLLRKQYEKPVIALFVVTASFLLIALVNLTGLVVAHTVARQGDVAIRLALGIERWRLVRRAMIEGSLVACVALLGSGLAADVLCRLLNQMISESRSMPLTPPISVDWMSFAFAAIVTMTMATAVYALPAWWAVRTGELSSTVGQNRRMTPGPNSLGRWVIAAQIALSIVLIMGALVFTSSFQLLEANQTRYRDKDVLFTRLPRVPGDRAPLAPDYFRTLVQDLSTIPGATAAALSSGFPGYLGARDKVPVDRYGISQDAVAISAFTEFVSPGFFSTIGVTLQQGRDFSWTDGPATDGVAIVSRSFADQLHGSAEVLGAFIVVRVGNVDVRLRVVGVTENAIVGSVREPGLPVVFRPLMQSIGRAQAPIAHLSFVGTRSTIEPQFRDRVRRLGRHYVRSTFLLDAWLDQALMQERLLQRISETLAGLAVGMACLGLYVTLSRTAQSRSSEIAIRMTLGATKGKVFLSVLGSGARMMLTGAIVGSAGAAAAASVIRVQLPGLEFGTTTTIFVACLAMTSIGSIAALIPARWAANTDPSEVLRRS